MRREGFNAFVRLRHIQRQDDVPGDSYYVSIPLALATRLNLKAGMAVKVELEV